MFSELLVQVYFVVLEETLKTRHAPGPENQKKLTEKYYIINIIYCILCTYIIIFLLDHSKCSFLGIDYQFNGLYSQVIAYSTKFR